MENSLRNEKIENWIKFTKKFMEKYRKNRRKENEKHEKNRESFSYDEKFNSVLFRTSPEGNVPS